MSFGAFFCSSDNDDASTISAQCNQEMDNITSNTSNYASTSVQVTPKKRRSSIECTFATLMAGSSFEQMKTYNAQVRNDFPSNR